MISLRTISLLTVFGFLVGSFHWEVAQVLMWKTMVQQDSAELGVLGATRKALSGEAPCSKCKTLSKERLTPEDEEAITAQTFSLSEHFLCPEIGQVFPGPSSFTAHLKWAPSQQSRVSDPPVPPPV